MKKGKQKKVTQKEKEESLFTLFLDEDVCNA